MRDLANSFYSKIAVMHHYLSMAKKTYEEISDRSNYKLKKLFYVLRAASICNWIIEKNDIPHIDFLIVLENIQIDKNLKESIFQLIALKSGKTESYLHSGEIEIFEYIINSINRAEEIAQSLPVSNGNFEYLNQVFIKTLKNSWT